MAKKRPHLAKKRQSWRKSKFCWRKKIIRGQRLAAATGVWRQCDSLDLKFKFVGARDRLARALDRLACLELYNFCLICRHFFIIPKFSELLIAQKTLLIRNNVSSKVKPHLHFYLLFLYLFPIRLWLGLMELGFGLTPVLCRLCKPGTQRCCRWGAGAAVAAGLASYNSSTW